MKILFEGTTGSGKTFSAVELAKKLGRFIITAPCRQLVYEHAIKYGCDQDKVLTGEVNFGGNGGNIFAVYESAFSLDLSKFQTLIIDEAHFLSDEDRGFGLFALMQRARAAGLNVFLATATRNFAKPKGFDIVKLKAPIKFKKKQIDFDEFEARAWHGVPSIYFAARIDTAEEMENPITANTPAADRLQMQIDFTNGDINFISCTNVLAQGLNFPCENILIESNPWDNDGIIKQKLGRLGRQGLTENCELTYAYVDAQTHQSIALSKIKIPKTQKIQKKDLRRDTKYIPQETFLYNSLGPFGKKALIHFYTGTYAHDCPDGRYGEGIALRCLKAMGEGADADIFFEYNREKITDALENRQRIPKIIKHEWRK